MRTLIYILISIIAIFVMACESGIDPITPVNPGPDETPPVVTINYPTEGLKMSFLDQPISTINFDFEVSDDIELASISLNLNGEEIGKFEQFKDYRKAFINYTYDNLTDREHVLTVNAVDLSGKQTSQSVNFTKVSTYEPEYDGEIFYMSFNDNFTELIGKTDLTVVGGPGFATGKVGRAYAGVQNGYLTFNLSDLPETLGSDFSVGFWYRVTSVTTAPDDRAGIIVIGPVTAGADPDNQNNRTSGFRIFRENVSGKQRVKANVGNGTADGWLDNAAADLDPAAGTWHYITLTITAGKAALYIDGTEAATNNLSQISWNGCDIMSVGSGVPRFTEWNHYSDRSLIDELRLFNKALTPAEIQEIIAN